MKRGELRAEIAFLLNFNEGQADQDFTVKRLNKVIQYVYEAETERAQLEGQSRWFRQVQTITWSASAVTLQLPKTMSQKGLVGVYDITNANPGTKIQIRETSLDSNDCFWLDYKTLQWGSVGPSSAKQLQFHYMALPEFLAADDDEPQLIPSQYHWLLVWAAAVHLREVADEGAPQAWMQRLQDWRFDYWKFLSRGRPMSDPPSISNSLVNNDVGLLY